nr:hypothetical protein [uncultured Pseudomonas sp.]
MTNFTDIKIRSLSGETPLDTLRSTPGPLCVNLSTYPAYYEFSRSSQSAKGSVGALGSFEMNMSVNMDYADGIHRLYDKTKDAYWYALSTGGFFMQYAPATEYSGDVWDYGGKQYSLKINMQLAQFSGSLCPIYPGVASVGTAAAPYSALFLEKGEGKTLVRVVVPSGVDEFLVVHPGITEESTLFINVSKSLCYCSAQAVSGDGIMKIRLSSSQQDDISADILILN